MHIPCHSGPQVDEKTENLVFHAKTRFLAVGAGLPTRSALERIAPPPGFKWSESPHPPRFKWGEIAQSTLHTTRRPGCGLMRVQLS